MKHIFVQTHIYILKKTMIMCKRQSIWFNYFLVMCVMLIFVYLSKLKVFEQNLHQTKYNTQQRTTLFQQLVLKYMKGNLIILTTTDSFYMDLTLNLYYSSLYLFNISNYIFGCTHDKACKELERRNINHFKVTNISSGDKYTKFRSEAYNEKLYPKTTMVREALSINVSVLSVDTDIVFMKNPLPYLELYKKVDIATSQPRTGSKHCAGLYLANPTPSAITLHRHIESLQMEKAGSNQQIMNRVIKQMGNTLEVMQLNPLQFFDGSAYFNDFQRIPCCAFAFDQCCHRANAVIIHSNWMGPTPSGKIYRLKENLMWYNDVGRYYSSKIQKYLQLTLQGKMLTKLQQQRSLENAFQLAALLNRTLILPKFVCGHERCNFYNLFKKCVRYLHEHFGPLYREHMFSHHPLVPKCILNSQSEKLDLCKLYSCKKLDIFSARNLSHDIKYKLMPFQNYSILHISVPHFLQLQFDKNLAKMLLAMFSEK